MIILYILLLLYDKFIYLIESYLQDGAICKMPNWNNSTETGLFELALFQRCHTCQTGPAGGLVMGPVKSSDTDHWPERVWKL